MVDPKDIAENAQNTETSQEIKKESKGSIAKDAVNKVKPTSVSTSIVSNSTKPIHANVENITVKLQVVLATKEYKIRELNNLKVSDVIKIGAINDFIFIYANDVAVARGELINGEEGVFVEIIEIL